MSVFREYFVLSGGGLCDGPVPRPVELYRLWCDAVYDPENLRTMTPWPGLGRSAKKYCT